MIKGSQIYYFGNVENLPSFLISRLQSATYGVDRRSTIYRELGNSKTVGEVLDSPELSFDIESFDSSAAFEFLFAGVNYSAAATGTSVTIQDLVKKVDVISPFKETETEGASGYPSVFGVAVPGITLEEITYSFTADGEATLRSSARGSELYYIPGKPVRETFVGNGIATSFTATQATSATPPILTKFRGDDAYFYYVEVGGSRKYLADDYTENWNGSSLVINFLTAPPSGTLINVIYGVQDTAYYLQTIHPDTTTIPEALKHGYVSIYLNNTFLPNLTSFELTARGTVDYKRELGVLYPLTTKEIPEVTGTLRFRPRDRAGFYAMLKRILNITADRTIHVEEVAPNLPIEIRLTNPYTGNIIKTLYSEAIRLNVPGFEARPPDDLEPEISFSCPTSDLAIYKGAKP